MKEQLLSLGYSEEQAETILNKKVYFQADVDNITEKVKNTLNKEFDKKYNELSNETNKIKLETKFVENGGLKSAFNDFYNATKDFDFNQAEAFNALKNQKPYFFKNVSPYDTPNFDINKERDKIKLDDNSDLWDGTIYKKHF